MKCVILAAGEGKRMHPLTFTKPKVMLPIANKPVLEWNLLNAKDAGLKDFIFIVNYKSEMVRNFFGNGEKWDINISYINQGKPLGTGHAIGIVEKFVKDFIVLCGDTIFGKQDIKKILENIPSMGLVEVNNPKEYGIVDTQDNKIIKIYEKMENPISNTINAGIYHFNQKIFDMIKKTNKSSRGEYEITDSINMIVEDEEMQGIFIENWRDVVYPWHLLDANQDVINEIDGKVEGKIFDNVTLNGKVIVGENSKLLPGTFIEGPVIIGSNCKIGPNCYIRPYTSIGNSCHIGNASEVKNSIIMDNSNAPHQNYVGDSIIGHGCNLGAGTKIANLRLDKKNIDIILNGTKLKTEKKKLGTIIGDNVQTGINSMLNVGSIIGNNVFIGPGAQVSGEIKPNSKIL